MKTILWQSENHQLEKLAKRQFFSLLNHFLRVNLGRNAIISLSDGTKLNAILTGSSQRFHNPQIFASRQDGNRTRLSIIRSQEIVTVGVNFEPTT